MFYFANLNGNRSSYTIMRIITILLLLITQFVFSQEKQKVETYRYGHDGIELVSQSKKETIIVSTYNSKMNIREDIAHKVYVMYLADKIVTNKIITINGIDATVTGKCIIRKKNNLTVVDFYYETIQWCSGLLEIYKKKMG